MKYNQQLDCITYTNTSIQTPMYDAQISESHVVSSIVDDLYVVDGSIGIPIKGIRLENYDPICVFIDLIIYMIATI